MAASAQVITSTFQAEGQKKKKKKRNFDLYIYFMQAKYSTYYMIIFM